MTLVPWHEQTQIVATIYKCYLCGAEEKYRAIDNVPYYAHLCEEHWKVAAYKTHFIKVETKK